MKFKDWLFSEVDWKQFSDVQRTCIEPEELVQRLNNELERLSVSGKKRKPFKKGEFPQISTKNIPLERGHINVQKFIEDITSHPKTIFDIGVKSQHSNELDKDILTINTGIPALRSILWDKKYKKFYVINTCPMAGQCIRNCYALKGYYILSSGKNLKLTQRLNLLINDPESYEDRAKNEIMKYAYQASIGDYENDFKKKDLKIRWNDAGDFFSQVYFDIAISITKKLKKFFKNNLNIDSYAYTKNGQLVNLGEKAGILMSFSLEGKPSSSKNLQMEKTKLSVIVPREVSQGLFEKKSSKFVDPSGPQELKRRIVNWVKEHPNISNVNLRLLKFTNELVKKKYDGKNKLKYNVIVLPYGDSDISAQRRDVRITFLLEH